MRQERGFLRRLLTAENALQSLLVFVPAAAIIEWTHGSPAALFITAALAIIPLAGLIGKATEHLASRVGEGVGGILNATFGNAAEFIIALVALSHGQVDVVKASLTGSIIGNILLVFGLAAFLGGLKHRRQEFNRTAAAMASTLLTLSTIGLIVPAVHHLVSRGLDEPVIGEISVEISIVLLVTYLLSLVFTLKTHSHLYTAAPEAAKPGHPAAVAHAHWSVRRSIVMLLVSAALVGWMSEMLVGAVEEAAHALGFTTIFAGVILVAVIGNAAEHSTAVIVAMKNRMDLALHIALGSSLQIALFVAPALVLVSYLFERPMDLLFTPFEVVTVALSVGVVNLVAADGETNWMEGFQLLAVYIILAIAFYFLPV
jgi:Ca2+:H+ antiporter